MTFRLPLLYWRLADDPLPPATPPPGTPPPPAPFLLAVAVGEPLPEAVRADLAASLSPQEHQRHQALRCPEDRERFLRGRGALRRLLGAWRDEAPPAVPIAGGRHGKPCCLGGPEFNLSHSGDLILLAVHQQRPVGVDVERLRPGLAWRPIAQRVLPPADWQALEALAAAAEEEAAEQEAAEAFLVAWCRLEARLKAEGVGLAGLDNHRQRPSPDGAGLHLWDVAVPAGYRAAVALAGDSLSQRSAIGRQP
jgi:4'-phosphopantetheinyl transferase